MIGGGGGRVNIAVDGGPMTAVVIVTVRWRGPDKDHEGKVRPSFLYIQISCKHHQCLGLFIEQILQPSLLPHL